MFLGELSLDGSVRPVRGALSATLEAREVGLKSVAVPEANAREAVLVEGIASKRRSGRWRSHARAGTIFCLSDHLARARPCWPSASPRFSFSFHACRGDESVSLRIFWRPYSRVPLHPADDPEVCFENIRPAARPDRRPHRGPCRKVQRAAITPRRPRTRRRSAKG